MDTIPLPETRGLLFDMVRCTGCRSCINACLKAHDFPGEAKDTTELSAKAYTAMRQEGEFNVRQMCRHCVTPSCASVCPVAALHKTDLGPVVYDESKCIGCRYCMVACPFNVPRYEWDEPVPAVRKCDMCIDRLREGKVPACAESCRFEATVAGTRAELLAEARNRIAEDPDMYFNHIYGEAELGGTSVLFLAPYPVDSLGYRKELGNTPLPTYTWNVLEKLPGVVVVGGAALSALWWITRRREDVAAFEGAEKLRRKGLKGKGESPSEVNHDDDR
jgi:formate dehydrogenase iron-sulfur subunit